MQNTVSFRRNRQTVAVKLHYIHIIEPSNAEAEPCQVNNENPP